jgi:cell division protein FtsW
LIVGRARTVRVGGARRATASGGPSEYSLLLTATLCLLAFGAVMVFSASSTTQILGNGGIENSVYFLKRTVLFGAAGLVLMHLLARRGVGAVRALTPLLLTVSLVLLVAVLMMGSTVNGAQRWLGSGFLQIQPSELAKVALVLYGAHILAARPRMVLRVRTLMPYLLVVAFACGLIVLEPDLGTALVAAFAVAATLIAAGARLRDLALIALVLGFLVAVVILLEPYRRERLFGFLHPGTDAVGAGFQAVQAKIALGSGGILGVGLGDGVQKAYYLPEAHTDMIAAVIGEEIGLVGICGLVGLFGLFGYAGFRTAQRARDHYSKLLAAGLTALIMIQATVNLFAVMGLAPLTGVPLPFVSYGNSSLLVTLASVGLILNVARANEAAATGRSRRPAAKTAKRRAASRPRRSRPAARPARGAGRLRVVEGGRSGRGRSRSSSGTGRDSGGRHSGTRRPGARRRRRASG